MAWPDKVRNRAGKLLGFKIRYRFNGQVLSSPTFSTKAEAITHLARYQGIEDSAKPLDGTRTHSLIPLLELIIRFVSAKVKDGEMREEYREERLRDLRRTIKLGGWALTSDVTVSSVMTWREKLVGTGKRDGAYLKAVLNWANAKLDQPIQPKVLVELRPPRTPRRVVDRPTSEDVRQWIATAKDNGDQAHALVLSLVWQGIRPSTAKRIKIYHYHPDDGGYFILGDLKGQAQDTKKTYLFPMVKAAIDKIINGRAPHESLYLNPRTGKSWDDPKDRCAITHWWYRHIESRRGKGVYNLKYDAISYLLEHLSPAQVQAFTLHADISQLMIYDRTNDVIQKAAILSVMQGARWEQNLQPAEIPAPPENHKPLPEHKATRA